MTIIECDRKHEYGLLNYSKVKLAEHEKLQKELDQWIAKGNQIKACTNTNAAHSFNPSNPDALHELLKKKKGGKRC